HRPLASAAEPTRARVHDRRPHDPRHHDRRGEPLMTTADFPLAIHALPTAQEMSAAAAAAATSILRQAISERGRARLMLAAAPSQPATLHALAANEGLDFSALHCFHIDDYIGLAPDAPQCFGNCL